MYSPQVRKFTQLDIFWDEIYLNISHILHATSVLTDDPSKTVSGVQKCPTLARHEQMSYHIPIGGSVPLLL